MLDSYLKKKKNDAKLVDPHQIIKSLILCPISFSKIIQHRALSFYPFIPQITFDIFLLKSVKA